MDTGPQKIILQRYRGDQLPFDFSLGARVPGMAKIAKVPHLERHHGGAGNSLKTQTDFGEKQVKNSIQYSED